MAKDDYLTEYQRGQKDMRTRAEQACYDADEETTCSACNGSGRYDHNGSPKCGACDGEGTNKTTAYDMGYVIQKLELKQED